MKTRLCGWTGCRHLTDGSYYCPEHKAAADKKREEYKKQHSCFSPRGKSAEYNDLYRSARWRRERAIFLKEHPYCYLCGADAKIVDHIHPHHGNLELFWDSNNWQPMCISCHSAKTMRENNYYRGKRNEK